MDVKRLHNCRHTLCSSILLPAQIAHQTLNLLELVLSEERAKHPNLKTHGLRHPQRSQQPACEKTAPRPLFLQPQSLPKILEWRSQTCQKEHELVCLKQHVQKARSCLLKAVVDGLHQMCNEQRVADQLLQPQHRQMHTQPW